MDNNTTPYNANCGCPADAQVTECAPKDRCITKHDTDCIFYHRNDPNAINLLECLGLRNGASMTIIVERIAALLCPLLNGGGITPLTVSAGPDQTLVLPLNHTTLAGSASGSGVSYQWTKVSGGQATLVSPSLSSTELRDLAVGDYVFRLTVTDQFNQTAFADIEVHVILPAGPTANAGADQSITLPVDSVSLAGNGTGTGIIVSWVNLSANQATILSPSNLHSVVNSLVPGVYSFQLVVTDQFGRTANDTMILTVSLPALSVNAGPDRIIQLPTSTVTAGGSGAGVNVTYSWQKVSGPAITINTPTSPTSVFSAIASAGTYIMRLTVIDGYGQSAHDDMTITVTSPTNLPPLVNAGVDQNITTPSGTNFLGTAAGLNGATIVSKHWTQNSGPNTATIADANSLTSAVSNLIAGTYQFTLTATDNNGLTNSDTVIMTVVDATSTFLAEWGWNSAPFALVAPVITQASNVNNGNGTRTQTFTLSGGMPAEAVYDFSVYSHAIRITVFPGDTLDAIAARVRDAINATTETQWNSAGVAPSSGTPGFKPVASASGANVVITLNAANQFSAFVTAFNDPTTFVYQGNATLNHNDPIHADYRSAPPVVSNVVLRYPVTEPTKTVWFNTPLNSGTVPDQVFVQTVIVGSYKYTWSNVQPGLDPSQLTTFS